MKYKIILFDADGTLLDYEKAESFALKNAFLQINYNYNPDTVLLFYREINKNIWKEFEKGEITSVELRSKRFDILFDKIGFNFDSHLFSKYYLNHLKTTGFLLPDVHNILKILSLKYYLTLITNGLKDVQYSRLEEAGIRKYFKIIAVSEEVGSKKPEKEIFEFIFNKTSEIDPSSAIIVGDSLSSDIKGGASFGIDTCWYNPCKLENKTGISPTYEINNLSELLTIF